MTTKKEHPKMKKRIQRFTNIRENIKNNKSEEGGFEIWVLFYNVLRVV